MDKLLAQLILTALVTGFAAILLFIAEVSNGVLKALSEDTYQDLMKLLFGRSSRSLVLSLTGAVPFSGLIAYVVGYGVTDRLFLSGGLVYVLSIVAASQINDRRYKRVEAASRIETGAIFAARSALCNANWIRAQGNRFRLTET